MGAVDQADVAALLARLKQRWPNTFTSPPRPLAIGIRPAIANELWPLKAPAYVSHTKECRLLSAALQQWCSAPEYLECCCMLGHTRFGLHGEADGVVSYPEAKFAASELAKAAP